MTISIEQIKQLRDATGVSMSACKAALEESGGHFDAAIDVLRKRGQAKAASKAGQETGEGVVLARSEGDRVAIVQLMCETDFMARNDDFLQLGQVLLGKLLAGEVSPEAEGIDEIREAVLKLGENVHVGRMSLLVHPGSVFGIYVHSNGKLGAAVVLDGGNDELARDIAMHVTASNPEVIRPEEIAEELVSKEKEIWFEQLKNEGKPEEIIEKIMLGKEKKFREENALIKQHFVKDPEKTVEQLLGAAGATVKTFVRFSI